MCSKSPLFPSNKTSASWPADNGVGLDLNLEGKVLGHGLESQVLGFGPGAQVLDLGLGLGSLALTPSLGDCD